MSVRTIVIKEDSIQVPLMSDILNRLHNDDIAVARELMETNFIRPMVDKLVESGVIGKPSSFDIVWEED